MKILVIRLSSIGDIVLSTSFLQSVKTKFPDSQIDFLIKSEFADIMRHHPLIDDIIVFKKKTGLKGLIGLGKTLRRNDYGMVYDIHSVFRTRILSFFLRKRFFKQIKKPRLRRFLLFYGYQNFFEKSFFWHRPNRYWLGDFVEQVDGDRIKVAVHGCLSF